MNGRIGARQTYVLAIGLLMGTATLLPVAKPAGRDGWLAILLGAAAAAVSVILWRRLIEAVPAQPAPAQPASAQLGSARLAPTPDSAGSLSADAWSVWAGPVTGRAIAGVYFLFLTHLAALVMYQMSAVITMVPLPHTPVPVVIVLFVGLAAWAATYELEGVARLAETVIPLAFAASLIVLLLAVATPNLVHLDRLLPVLDQGWRPVSQGALAALAFPFGELVCLLPFADSYRLPFHWARAVWRAVAIVTLLLIGLSVRNLGALGAAEAGRIIFPGLSTVEMIQIGHFVERVESVSLFVWVNAGFVKLTVILLAASRALLGLLALPASCPRSVKTPLVLAVAFCVAVLGSGLYKAPLDAAKFLSRTFPVYAVIFEILIPALVLLGYRLRSGQARKQPANPPA